MMFKRSKLTMASKCLLIVLVCYCATTATALTPAPAPAPGTAPGLCGAVFSDPYQQHFSLNGSCYYAFNNLTVHSAATGVCLSGNSHLIYLETTGEAAALRTHLVYSEFWIGLEKHNGAWKWTHNGNTKDLAWANPPLMNSSDSFTVAYAQNFLFADNWMEASSNHQSKVICEHDANFLITNPTCQDFPPLYSADHKNESDNSCYWGFQTPLTFSDAKQHCLSGGTHLVFIETKDEKDYLKNITSFPTEFWLGLENLNTVTGDWRWAVNTSYKGLTWSSWAAGYQAYAEAAYAQRDTGNWMTVTASAESHSIICERSKSGSTTGMCGATFEEPFQNYYTKSSSCYYAFTAMKTLDEATTLCSSGNTHMIFLETEDEANNLRSVIDPTYTEFWLGLENIGATWKWSNNGITKLVTWSSQPWISSPPSDTYAFAKDFNINDKWEGAAAAHLSKVICEHSIAQDISPECFANFTQQVYGVKEITGFCFYVFQPQLDYLTGKAACQSGGARPVILDTQEKSNAIQAVMDAQSGLDEFWLGLEKISDEWKWFDGSGYIDLAWTTPPWTATPTFYANAMTKNFFSAPQWEEKDAATTGIVMCEKEKNPTASTISSPCTDTFSQPTVISEAAGSSCYYGFSTDHNYTDAVTICNSGGAHLVFLEAVGEVDLIRTKFEPLISTFWLGIERLVLGSPWKWTSSGISQLENRGNSVWVPGRPVVLTTHAYLQLYTPEQWYDVYPIQLHPVICEKEVTQSTTTSFRQSLFTRKKTQIFITVLKEMECLSATHCCIQCLEIANCNMAAFAKSTRLCRMSFVVVSSAIIENCDQSNMYCYGM